MRITQKQQQQKQAIVLFTTTQQQQDEAEGKRRHNDRSSSTEEYFCFFFIPGNETGCLSSSSCSHDLRSLVLALFSRSSARIPQEPDGRALGATTATMGGREGSRRRHLGREPEPHHSPKTPLKIP